MKTSVEVMSERVRRRRKNRFFASVFCFFEYNLLMLFNPAECLLFGVWFVAGSSAVECQSTGREFSRFALFARDHFRFFLSGAVRTKSNNDRPIDALAQLAIGAGDVIALLGWANDALAACRREKCRRCAFWNNANDRPGLQFRQSVGVADIVAGKINSEAVFIC